MSVPRPAFKVSIYDVPYCTAQWQCHILCVQAAQESTAAAQLAEAEAAAKLAAVKSQLPQPDILQPTTSADALDEPGAPANAVADASQAMEQQQSEVQPDLSPEQKRSLSEAEARLAAAHAAVSAEEAAAAAAGERACMCMLGY